MERRLLVTFLACFLFTLLYWKIVAPPPKAPSPGPTETATATSGESAASTPTASGYVSSAPVVPGDFPVTSVGVIDIQPFENDFLRVEFTNRGASVTQVYLKKYRVTASTPESDSDPSGWVTLFPDPSLSYGNPLALRELTGMDQVARYGLEDVHWDVEDVTSSEGRVLTFRYRAADGLELEKRISCGAHDSYLTVEVAARAHAESLRGSAKTFLLRAAGGIQDVERGQWTDPPKAVAMIAGLGGDNTVTVQPASELAGDPATVAGRGRASLAWAGCTNLYFAALLAPHVAGEATSADLRAANEDVEEKIQADLVVPLPLARDGSFTPVGFTYYLGPKDPDHLDAQGLSIIQPLVEENYGSSFRWVNVALLAILRFFHGFVGNWGVAIILLTLMVRVLIFPITRTQQVSMQRYSQKMQVLKPKLDQLRDRYKDKPQKFAQEQMKLLKEHNARPPLLGCLSIFITFPVFIGMFQILRTAIELRQAPFVGWIGDLSLPDSMFTVPGVGIGFNLLPILATGAFVAQMMMAPKPADPQARQQQKIMFFMPIVFGVMFYNYAAGLSLYMLTSSLYGMFESKFIRKRYFSDAVAKPAAARA